MVLDHSNLVYFKTERDVWSPGKLLEQSGKTALVEHNGIQVVVDLSEYKGNVLPQQNVDDQGALLEVEDMVNLSYLHEVSLRYKNTAMLTPGLCSRLRSFTTLRHAMPDRSLTPEPATLSSQLILISGSENYILKNNSAGTLQGWFLTGDLQRRSLRMFTRYRRWPTAVSRQVLTNPSSCPESRELGKQKQ
jgi:hypothetical protein